MRICFVSMTSLFLCPYIDKYYSLLCEGNTVDLVLWNRHETSENTEKFNRVYEYKVQLNEHQSKVTKFFQFYRFSKFCKKVLSSVNYDRIVFLHNNSTIFISSYLKRKYKGRYIIDIRDYTMEKNPLYFALEKKVIVNSGMAVISSPGYKEFLPKWNYFISHNDNFVSEEDIALNHGKNLTKLPIQISFIGLVRFYEQNKILLNIFANDSRFKLAFYGKNSEPLKEYAEKNGIKNVEFVGHFDPSMTMDFYKKTDIINNYYGNKSIVLKYALSNKLYYAATLGLPILVCENTYMMDVSKKYAFGIGLNPDALSPADELYNQYVSMDKQNIISGGKAFMEEVARDNTVLMDALNLFIGRGGTI